MEAYPCKGKTAQNVGCMSHDWLLMNLEPPARQKGVRLFLLTHEKNLALQHEKLISHENVYLAVLSIRLE